LTQRASGRRDSTQHVRHEVPIRRAAENQHAQLATRHHHDSARARIRIARHLAARGCLAPAVKLDVVIVAARRANRLRPRFHAGHGRAIARRNRRFASAHAQDGCYDCSGQPVHALTWQQESFRNPARRARVAYVSHEGARSKANARGYVSGWHAECPGESTRPHRQGEPK
jgi:hypothetical protein